MGRLSRHKRIKACDPFNTNKRKVLAAQAAKLATKDEPALEGADKVIPRAVREMQALQKREEKKRRAYLWNPDFHLQAHYRPEKCKLPRCCNGRLGFNESAVLI